MNRPAALLLAAMAAMPGDPPAAPGHPYHREQHANAPAEMWAVIEIPLGSAVKYEFDKATGHLFVDRFQSMPVAAPANYGSFQRTLAVDGDPLDAVVLSRHPVQAGAFLRVRPVGVIRTVDGEHKDDKILVVPVSQIDPTYDEGRDLNDVPKADASASPPTSASTSSCPPASKAGSSKPWAAKPRSASSARPWRVTAGAWPSRGSIRRRVMRAPCTALGRDTRPRSACRSCGPSSHG